MEEEDAGRRTKNREQRYPSSGFPGSCRLFTILEGRGGGTDGVLAPGMVATAFVLGEDEMRARFTTAGRSMHLSRPSW